MPMRFLAYLMPTLIGLAACMTAPTDQANREGIGPYLIVVTDKAGTRPFSEEERNDPRVRVAIDACRRADGPHCLVTPDLGRPRNVFTRQVDEAVVVAFLGQLRPGKHLMTCKWSGPVGETFVGQYPIDFDPAQMAASSTTTWCRFELNEGGLWTPGVWQVELLIDGEVLARPTFTIRERGETIV